MLKKNTIKVHSPKQVTRIDRESECDPRDVGLSQKRIDAIWNAVVDFYTSGIQPAISICIRREGKIILNRAIGHTHGNGPGELYSANLVQATPDSLFNLFSASKAISAMVIHHMAEKGLLHLDDAVAVYLPEFEEGAKRHITISHVLTHQAGVPVIPEEALDLDILMDPDKVREIFRQSPTQWKAGYDLGYHALSGGFILAELVRVITGESIRDYLAKHILLPLGFKHFNYGVPAELASEVAPHVYTGMPFPSLIDNVFIKRILGVTYGEAIELSNDERFLTGIIPSANIIGTAEETSRFYELLLRDGTLNGVQIFKPETVRNAHAMHVDGFDKMLNIPVKYSQGFMLGRKYLSMYGLDTEQVFGHIGFMNVVGYADPERDISVGLMNNGKPGLTPKMIKFLNVMNTIARQIPKV